MSGNSARFRQIPPNSASFPSGARYSLPFGPSTTTAVATAPSRPARPSSRMSSIALTVLQCGQVAPARLIVPAPRRRSCSRRCAALPPLRGGFASTPKATPPSPSGSIVSRTRLPSFRHSQRVLSSGTRARQFLQATVRAQRVATVGFATQRGLRGSFSQASSRPAFRAPRRGRPSASVSSSRNGRFSQAAPPGASGAYSA